MIKAKPVYGFECPKCGNQGLFNEDGPIYIIFRDFDIKKVGQYFNITCQAITRPVSIMSFRKNKYCGHKFSVEVV